MTYTWRRPGQEVTPKMMTTSLLDQDQVRSASSIQGAQSDPFMLDIAVEAQIVFVFQELEKLLRLLKLSQ